MQVIGINGQMEVEENQMLHKINPFFIIGLPYKLNKKVFSFNYRDRLL